ncbi:NLI interacting factor-like phosphatase domain-containing protein [Phytophthora infestans]|uniref:NLI interacting factor-like phosphatase domain-containing protein n=1 Tax=Phytophthora infestans TaxID=4787 RepID=A0A833SFI7_PHYIN|nr:NLI interacting factor-like phosphatase domain-containing protein [Phytophthora infestans]
MITTAHSAFIYGLLLPTTKDDDVCRTIEDTARGSEYHLPTGEHRPPDRQKWQAATNSQWFSSQVPRSIACEGDSAARSLRHIFGSVLSKFSLSEQQEDQQKAKQGRPLTSKIQTVGTTIQLRPSLLPPVSFVDADKKCLVLDLDETLVHSSFRPTNNYDFIIPVEIDGSTHLVYVCKRPGAEEFLIEMAKYYEIVVYTASLSVYADPLLDKLDPEGTISYRLYREHCVQYEGCYVKNLSLLDRDITQTIIVDNSPMAYAFHFRNAIGCSSFYDDLNDRELQSIGRFLTKFQEVEDVRNHMQTWDANY